MPAAKNLNRVPQSEWRKWSDDAKRVFNAVYVFMVANPDLMLHPKAAKAPAAHWKTTAWNSAWIAADAVDDKLPTEVVTLDRGKEVSRSKIKKAA